MAFVRFLAYIFLLAALFVLAVDVTHPTAPSFATALIETWGRLAPASVAAAQAAVSRATHPVVWELSRTILSVPTWGLLTAVGLVCAYAGRRRRRVEIFAN